MGAVFVLKCPKCKYHLEWEMWIAHDYRRKHNTPQEIEDGLWGEELREVILNKGNKINMEVIMLVCDDCGNIKVLPSLAYKEQLVEWKIPENMPITEIKAELDRHYKDDYSEWKKYPHRCEKCNNLMKQIFNPKEEGPIHCPKCKSVLRVKWTGVS